MKPFYKSVSVILALNFGNLQSATIVEIVEEKSSRTAAGAGALLSAPPLSPYEFCKQEFVKTYELRSPAFPSSAFRPGLKPPSILRSIAFPMPNDQTFEWLNKAFNTVSPVEIFQIIDDALADKPLIKAQVEPIVKVFFQGLLKHPDITFSPTDFPYRVIGLQGSESISFTARYVPLREEDASYNAFASALYEQLIVGGYYLGAAPTPVDLVAFAPRCMHIFATYYRTLNEHSAHAASRFELMRAAAHSLFDFNRGDTSLIRRALSSTLHKASGTSCVENAAVSLAGLIPGEDERAVPREVLTATKIFINQLLSLLLHPFVESVVTSGRIEIKSGAAK